MRIIRILFIAVIFFSACIRPQEEKQTTPPLRVSDDGRFLVTSSGEPFFWLGDTGWRIFANLTREEALRYLKDRKSKGFNVIQCQLLPVNPDLPNVYGYLPFEEMDIRKPVEEYWAHVEYVIHKAGELGMYMAILPAWARTYIEPRLGNKEYKLFTDDPEGAYGYGFYLGNRFREMNNLVWVLGGDSWGTKDSIYNSMAAGITDGYRDGDDSKVLMSYHPQGGTYRPPATSSGEFYHSMDWLDFNMIQSGHRIGNRNFEKITEDYQRVPVKPTLESEPCYENHPVRHNYENGRFNAWHVRRRAYWAILAGSLGYTYGGNGIWQMSTEERPGKESHFSNYWYDALNYPGACQMIYVRRLFESRPFIDPDRIPDQDILADPSDSTDEHIQCARAKDFSYWIIYVTNGRKFSLKGGRELAENYRAWWYDPRSGECLNPDSNLIRKPFELSPTDEEIVFDPPGMEGPGKDWVLLLDEKNSHYRCPGDSKH